jgi:uncharacterized protein YjiS (DUF1127 family)
MHQTHAGSETFRSAHSRQSSLYFQLSKEGDNQMGIRTTLKKWAAYQQTVRELAALDNRQLGDLGITRTDISRIARDHARTL